MSARSNKPKRKRPVLFGAPLKALLPKRIKVETCRTCGATRITIQDGTYKGFVLEGCMHLGADRVIKELRARLKLIQMERKPKPIRSRSRA